MCLYQNSIIPPEKVNDHIGCNRKTIKNQDQDINEFKKVYLTYFPLTDEMEEYFKYFVVHEYPQNIMMFCKKSLTNYGLENNQPISPHTQIGFSFPDEETAFYFKLKFC